MSRRARALLFLPCPSWHPATPVAIPTFAIHFESNPEDFNAHLLEVNGVPAILALKPCRTSGKDGAVKVAGRLVDQDGLDWRENRMRAIAY